MKVGVGGTWLCEEADALCKRSTDPSLEGVYETTEDFETNPRLTYNLAMTQCSSERLQ